MEDAYSAYGQGCPPWEEKELQTLRSYQPSPILDSSTQHAHYHLGPQSHSFPSMMPGNISMMNSFADCLPPLQMVPNLNNFNYNYPLEQKNEPEKYDEVNHEETVEESPKKAKKRNSSDRRKKTPIYQDEFIDTKKLCEEIAYELKCRSIPQTLFAEKIIGRSQGTLSDLLKNPKPWDKLKSGRETFKRMKQWLDLPLVQRMAVFDMEAESDTPMAPLPFSPAVESAKKQTNKRKNDGISPCKRPRLVFTELQKRTLDAIFDETRNPSREMQEIIAARLQLEFATINNYFMNMRRRSKLGDN